MDHFASIDLEDWYYDVEEVRPVDDGGFRRAFARQLDVVRRVLDESGARVTFFVLGRTAERYPDAVKGLAAEGHEIASHGYGHERVFTLDRRRFRDDVARSVEVLAALTGKAPMGYRAPYFSVGREQLAWLYDELAALGFRYSSSVFPWRRARGLGDHPAAVVERAAAGGKVVLEVPLTVVEVLGRRLPLAGGGFWRASPRALVQGALRLLEARERPFVMYLHPHELDPLPLRSHRGPLRDLYVNLGRRSIEGKLGSVLRRHRFVPLERLVA